jgi:hypothetical protein
MAKIIENQIVVTHYPRQPFGKHAGTYSITTRLGRENYADDPVPLSGCTLDDPLDAEAKARLCALSLARIDAGGRFAVDYAALRAHLRAVCRVRDEDLHGLAWATIMDILRPVEVDRLALTELEQEILFVLDERETLTTTPQMCKVLKERGTGGVESTVKQAVRHLRELGLVERPQTSDGRPTRKGCRITARGKQYLTTS